MTRGRYVHVGDAQDADARLAALLDVLPRAAVSHWTAASLWGAPVPGSRLGRTHVSVVTGTCRPARRGVVAHHAGDLPVATVRGLRVTSPVRTWSDLAADGASVTELVVVGDSLGHRGLATPEELSTAALLPRRRGGRRMREAVGLVDPRAESGPETRLRLLLRAGGLPAPEVNHVVRDAQGLFVARVDLAWPEDRLVVEYDGDHHRDPDQWVRDLRRRERLEALGWTVVVITAADMRGPHGAVVSRVAGRLRSLARRAA